MTFMEVVGPSIAAVKSEGEREFSIGISHEFGPSQLGFKRQLEYLVLGIKITEVVLIED